MSDPNYSSNPNNRQTGEPDPLYAQRQTDTQVTISLVLGILGLFTCGLTSFIGLVLIIIARRRGATGALAIVSLVINIVLVCAGLVVGGSVLFFAVTEYINAAAEASAGVLFLR